VEVKLNQDSAYKWRLVLAYDGTRYAGMNNTFPISSFCYLPHMFHFVIHFLL
jgi:hypothetical protein